MKTRIAIFYLFNGPMRDIPDEQAGDYSSFGVGLQDGTFVAEASVRAELAPEGCTDLAQALDLARPRKGERVMNAHRVPTKASGPAF